MIPWSMLRPLAAPIALIALAAGSAWFVYSKGQQSGMQATQSAWDAEKVRTLEAQGEQILIAQIRETELTAHMDKLKRTHRETQTRIAADHVADLDRLRDRPEARASVGGVPEGAAVGVGLAGWCDGSRLYRDHAEVLVRESVLAAQLQSALNTCMGYNRQITNPQSKE